MSFAVYWEIFTKEINPFHFLNFLTCYNVNPLIANPTKWSNTFKQFVGKLPTNCLSVFDHFVGLALKGLKHLLVLPVDK